MQTANSIRLHPINAKEDCLLDNQLAFPFADQYQPALDVLNTPCYTLLPADPIWIINRFSRPRATTTPMASRRFAWQHLLPAPAQAYSELLRCGHRARATGCSKRRTVLHSPGNQASWKAHGCLAQPREVISFLFYGMRRHIHTCVYMCILMYVCWESVAHLYMIVLVMNDQTKLKLLCFFACTRRWPTVLEGRCSLQ